MATLEEVQRIGEVKVCMLDDRNGSWLDRLRAGKAKIEDLIAEEEGATKRKSRRGQNRMEKSGEDRSEAAGE